MFEDRLEEFTPVKCSGCKENITTVLYGAERIINKIECPHCKEVNGFVFYQGENDGEELKLPSFS